MTTEKLYELGHRSNILHKISTDKEVIIYEDHRTILNVLYHLITLRQIAGPVDLIMFDNHDDFCDPKPDTLIKLSKFLKRPSKEKLYQIVEFDLSILDDDWVKTGMELNLIGNCFLFNSDESSVHYRESYKTKKFGTKFLYNIGEVWSALGYHGKLNDPIKTEYTELWDDLGWEFVDHKYKFKENRRKYIFDIDLDCFTTRILDTTIAIPEEILIPRFTERHQETYHYYLNSQGFIKDVIKDSELVTICLESDCCGGIKQSQKIFNTIDYLFFDNELGEPS